LGYNTDFTGQVTITPPLNSHEIDYLQRFAATRHVHRRKGPYVVESTGSAEESLESEVISDSQPGQGPRDPWCKWEPTADGTAITWNGEEKFYDAEHWLAYLVDTFLKPDAALARERHNPVPDRVYPALLAEFTFDHVVNGVIEADGEWPDDRWRIEVRYNTVYVVRLRTEPDYDEIGSGHPDTWSDGQWAEFEARTRRNFVYVVRDGRLQEVGPADGTAFAPIPADGP
jgi:hypothetical protein